MPESAPGSIPPKGSFSRQEGLVLVNYIDGKLNSRTLPNENVEYYNSDGFITLKMDGSGNILYDSSNPHTPLPPPPEVPERGSVRIIAPPPKPAGGGPIIKIPAPPSQPNPKKQTVRISLPPRPQPPAPQQTPAQALATPTLSSTAPKTSEPAPKSRYGKIETRIRQLIPWFQVLMGGKPDKSLTGPARTKGGFRYEAMDARGKPTTGTIEAASQSDAIERLKQMEFHPTKVTEEEMEKPALETPDETATEANKELQMLIERAKKGLQENEITRENLLGLKPKQIPGKESPQETAEIQKIEEILKQIEASDEELKKIIQETTATIELAKSITPEKVSRKKLELMARLKNVNEGLKKQFWPLLAVGGILAGGGIVYKTGDSRGWWKGDEKQKTEERTSPNKNTNNPPAIVEAPVPAQPTPEDIERIRKEESDKAIKMYHPAFEEQQRKIAELTAELNKKLETPKNETNREKFKRLKAKIDAVRADKTKDENKDITAEEFSFYNRVISGVIRLEPEE